jgi:hypothetical protein
MVDNREGFDSAASPFIFDLLSVAAGKDTQPGWVWRVARNIGLVICWSAPACDDILLLF